MASWPTKPEETRRAQAGIAPGELAHGARQREPVQLSWPVVKTTSSAPRSCGRWQRLRCRHAKVMERACRAGHSTCRDSRQLQDPHAQDAGPHRRAEGDLSPAARQRDGRHRRLRAQDAKTAALAPEERSHARTLGELARETVTRGERWHRNAGGGTLRAAVFGVNDGLVSQPQPGHGLRGRRRRRHSSCCWPASPGCWRARRRWPPANTFR